MKKSSGWMLLAALSVTASLVLAAGPPALGAEGKEPSYDPKKIYPGDYNAHVMMYRNPGSDMWQRVPGLDRLRHVVCRDALEQLQRQGRWQGHLKLDGSCGSTAEPMDWILGNRLNYEDALEEGGRR